MRYVPNLIPNTSKVLPEYFNGNIYKSANYNLLRDIAFWILGVFFFFPAMAFIRHPLLFLIFGLIGFILIPPGHSFLEQKLRFRLTPKIKAITTSVLFVCSIPLASHYTAVDSQVVYEHKLLDEKAAREKEIADQKEQERKDSLSFYIQQSNELSIKHEIEEANQQLQHALPFATTQMEKDQIEQEKIGIAAIKAIDLVKTGKYRIALIGINKLLSSDPENSELLYNRAICYRKTGKIQEAVNDLKPLIQSGNTEAIKLHDKINPIRKRVSFYLTRCWDGSTSNATGRGACSHHGGVKNWNEPVYEEYRKYE